MNLLAESKVNARLNRKANNGYKYPEMLVLSALINEIADANAKNSQNKRSSSYGSLITLTNDGMPPIRMTMKPMVKFNRGNLVKIQRAKLIAKRIVDIFSIGPNIFFDFLKDKININELPANAKIASRTTENLSFNKITPASVLMANNNQIIRL